MTQKQQSTQADLHPQTNDDVLAAVKWAAGEEVPLEIIGQGSKRALGRPMQTAHTLDMSALTGVTLFEPEELVLSAKAGTPLEEIVKLLDQHNQELQFEPMDIGPLLGNKPKLGTLGGLVSTNLSGPRRLKAGSVRDHILGVTAVSGRGEVFKSGGRVVKNVTGYDLSKGLTGAYGTLAVLTDIIVKVLPRAETEQTLVIVGLTDADAAQAMATAMGSNAEVSGAAHLPAELNQGQAHTYLRLEGFTPSVASRIENLSSLLKSMGAQERLDEEASRKCWINVRDCLPFAAQRDAPVWRVSCTPSEGHAIVHAVKNQTDVSAYYDWQGGLVWMQMNDGNPNAPILRNTIQQHGGGHATLIRADVATRQSTDVFQPQPAPLAALSKRYRENFDPKGVLNPGRMN